MTPRTAGAYYPPGMRVYEPHSHSAAFAGILFNEKLHRYVNLLYGDVAVALTSTYFITPGVISGLTRDPWYVVTRPPGNVLGVSIALEDLYPGSGEMIYVPRSHKIPYANLSNNLAAFSGASPSSIENHVRDMNEAVKKMKVKRWHGNRSQAFIWHANLVHGPSALFGFNSMKTRKTLDIHFDLLRKRAYGNSYTLLLLHPKSSSSA